MKENLILLHGALGSQAQFSNLKRILSDTFEVFAFNFEGHGGLPIKGPFRIDRFVRNTLDFMEVHRIQSAHFFGYSMGGYVALQLAHDHPEHVNKIVTLGTKFYWTPESAEKEVRMMNPEVIEKKIPAFAISLTERHHPEDWKDIMLRTGEMMTQLGNGAAMMANHFGEIENEVLVCIGTSDHMVSLEESEATAQQLKSGRLQTINGFKHPLEAIDQNLMAEICTGFFYA